MIANILELLSNISYLLMINVCIDWASKVGLPLTTKPQPDSLTTVANPTSGVITTGQPIAIASSTDRGASMEWELLIVGNIYMSAN